jgi:hypothetical protein
MARLSVQPGAVIDGFTIGECIHRGGMATLWSVNRPDIAAPLLMKIPRVSEGEDPAAIVSFEMEQMILPRLSGPHVPRCYATGDFAHQAYVVIEPIPGTTLYSRLADLPLAYDDAVVIAGKIAAALADLHRQNVIHHDIQPSSIVSAKVAAEARAVPSPWCGRRGRRRCRGGRLQARSRMRCRPRAWNRNWPRDATAKVRYRGLSEHGQVLS